jgi:uncharacterized membrane protein YebE (DUF533 family)
MRRLTISGQACTETLALLITMAWADGHLDESERAGVKGAAEVLNLSKELRERLELVMEKPTKLEYLLFEELTPRDKAFAYVAAAWMSNVDEDVHEKEEQMLDQLGSILGIDAVKKAELERIARDLKPAEGGRKWADEIVTLFKAIPPRLEKTEEEVDVVFE